MRRQYNQDDSLRTVVDITAQDLGGYDWRQLCERAAECANAEAACFAFCQASETAPSLAMGRHWPITIRPSLTEYRDIWQQERFYQSVIKLSKGLAGYYLAVPIQRGALSGLLLLKYANSSQVLSGSQRQWLDILAVQGALLWGERHGSLRQHRREGATRRLLSRLKVIFDHVPIPINVFNTDGKCVLWNRECERIFGWSFEEVRQHPEPISLFYPDPIEQQQVKMAFKEHSSSRFREWHPSNRAGDKLTVLWANIILLNNDMLSVGHDISKQKEMNRRQLLAASVFESSYNGIMIIDLDHNITHINPAYTRITGYSLAESVGRLPNFLQNNHLDDALYQELCQHFKEHEHWQGELSALRKNGETYALLLAISKVKDEHNQPLNYVAIFSDITYLKNHEAELKHQACHDVLTGVPNRLLFGELLEQAISAAERHQGQLAVCYLDLDGFKLVNDNLGHAAGDKLLVEISRRLGGVTRSCDAMARLGGDEFALLFTELHSSLECDEILTRVQSIIHQPFELEGQEVQVSASIGVALYPQDANEAELLLRYADQAMYQAKRLGKHTHVFFDAKLHLQEQDRRLQLSRIKSAFQQGELLLYYQPTIDLFNRQVIGLEALLRWHDPKRGLLTPSEFLPALVGTSLEFELGMWVIEQVLSQMTIWSQQGLLFKVSFNVSRGQLMHGNFSHELGRLLAKYPLVQPSLLELEFQECAVSADINAAVAVLQGCRQLGICVSLDNFGTGYASLSHLNQLPVTTLKIDRSFITNLLSNAHDVSMVESVVQLASALKMTVTAKGVESVEQGTRLQQLGCRYVQGYGISQPLPPEQVLDWLNQWNSQPENANHKKG
ncbi:sensor domain-containing protein [Oceanisphaera pacifica]|uniref:EAL domain-containing protein n=1 Tax=Oceanisphaera pacifica TaxID=2818389 RepID=A0ABS3NGE6_9GAMM|nr:EAL domain-containing protein [Oceanisphaera pacifica]MBO1519674.1 EAL domain-containing protein [Oceanisphaera pacifica]